MLREMNMTNELTTSTGADRSLEREVRDMLDLAAKLEALNVREATTGSGVRYVRDVITGNSIVAARDVILTKRRATLNITLVMPGASRDEVLAELQPATQVLRGAVVGRSQSWVSERESK
jgi:hypothetical protein